MYFSMIQGFQLRILQRHEILPQNGNVSEVATAASDESPDMLRTSTQIQAQG